MYLMYKYLDLIIIDLVIVNIQILPVDMIIYMINNHENYHNKINNE